MSANVPTLAPDSVEVSFPVVGMTCASCSNRIERFLRRTDGVVEANVNLATEVATIRFLPGRSAAAISPVPSSRRATRSVRARSRP